MTKKKKLHGLAEKGDLKTVKELVDLGADVNEPNTYGITPIYLAFCSGNEKLIEYLISKGADVNYANPPDGIPDCFCYAVMKSKTDWIVKFLKSGVNPNVTNSSGENLLYSLFSGQNFDVNTHKLLLEAGCNPETKGNDGSSAIDYLQAFGIKELNNLYSKYVTNLKIDPEVKDYTDQLGPEILFETVREGSSKDLADLIRANPGIELNKHDKGGDTALQLAVLLQKKNSAKVLLKNGADPLVPNRADNFELPLEMSEDWVARGILKFQEIVDLIKQILDKKNS